MKKAVLSALVLVAATSAHAAGVDLTQISNDTTAAVTTLGTVAGGAIAIFAAVVIGKKIIGYFRKAS